jgi:hypothetical protein
MHGKWRAAKRNEVVRTTVTLRFPSIHNSRQPHASRATIAAKYQGGQDISLAYLRECFILDPASPSGARWALPQTCGRNGTRATPGSLPGRLTAKGYFPISLTLGGRNRILRAHRRSTAPGFPAKSATGRSRFQRHPVEPLGHVGVARRQPSPTGSIGDSGGICLLDETIGARPRRDDRGSSFGSNDPGRGAPSDGGCRIMF